MKVEVEELESLRSLRPSAQKRRVNSWLSAERCAEGGTKNAVHAAAKLFLFCECKTVASGPERGCWSFSERNVIAAITNSLESCIDIRVEIKTLERLMEPGEAEVCLRYILKHATRRGSNIFQLFDTKEKKRTISWQAEGVG